MKTTLWMTALAMTLAIAVPAAHADEAAPTDDASAAVQTAKADESKKGDDVEVAVLGDTQSMEEVITEEEEGEAKQEPFPVGATIIYENAVGIGTFVGDEFQRRPLWSMSLSMRPIVRLGDSMSIIARLDIAKDIIENADSTGTVKSQTLLSDTILTFNMAPIVEEPVTGIKLSGWVDLLLPTSLLSQYQSKILTARLGLGLSKEFGWVNLYYQTRFSKNFHKYDHPVLSQPDGGIATCLPSAGGALVDTDVCAPGGVANSSFQFMNRGTVEFVPYEGLSITVDFIAYNDFTYDVNPDDALTNGNAVAGRGQRDLTQGTFEVGYQVNPYLGVSLGTTTLQPPKTLDNEGFRFPFFDFRTASNNFTTVYLDLVGTF